MCHPGVPTLGIRDLALSGQGGKGTGLRLLQGAPKRSPFTTPISLSHLHHPHSVIVPTAHRPRGICPQNWWHWQRGDMGTGQVQLLRDPHVTSLPREGPSVKFGHITRAVTGTVGTLGQGTGCTGTPVTPERPPQGHGCSPSSSGPWDPVMSPPVTSCPLHQLSHGLVPHIPPPAVTGSRGPSCPQHVLVPRRGPRTLLPQCPHVPSRTRHSGAGKQLYLGVWGCHRGVPKTVAHFLLMAL